MERLKAAELDPTARSLEWRIQAETGLKRSSTASAIRILITVLARAVDSSSTSLAIFMVRREQAAYTTEAWCTVLNLKRAKPGLLASYTHFSARRTAAALRRP